MFIYIYIYREQTRFGFRGLSLGENWVGRFPRQRVRRGCGKSIRATLFALTATLRPSKLCPACPPTQLVHAAVPCTVVSASNNRASRQSREHFRWASCSRQSAVRVLRCQSSFGTCGVRTGRSLQSANGTTKSG